MRPTVRPVRLLLLAGVLAALIAPARAAEAQTRVTPGPTLAHEDTMRTEVPEVLVRAPRVTLDEILDRVARGEARRDSMIRDQQVLVTARVVSGVDRAPQLLSERVFQVFKKRPNKVRSVTLRTYDRNPRGGANLEVNARGGFDEEIVNFAFQPAARKAFKYKIIGRDFVGGHVIYRIEFEPRSTLDPSQPSGVVWVDTNEFVIVRQEVRFHRSPVPVIVKDVRRMVVERRRFDDHWVLHRVLMRVEATLPLPRLGKSFDFSLRFDDYRINQGIDDAVFGEDS